MKLTPEHQDVIEQLQDPDYRGPMQHCRGWDELDRLRDAALKALTTQKARGVTLGLIIAAAIAMRAHGDETVARSILGSAGIKTLAQAKKAGSRKI